MQIVNQPQADFWTSPAGRAWVEHERSLDVAMTGILDMLLDAAALAPAKAVLDIGCGTGASTLAAARLVSPGTVLGLDIAAPMLDRARQRALAEGVENASFQLGDAQVEPLPALAFDALISRFGMSFFDDTVAAFRNLARALRDGGRMVFVSWDGLDRNPWFSIPQQAAERRLGALPDQPSNAPGPLAFADPAHVLGLMGQAGLTDGRADTRTIDLMPPGGPSGAARLATQLGPAARLMRICDATPEDRTAIAAEIEEAFTTFGQGAAFRIPSSVHVYTCRAGQA